MNLDITVWVYKPPFIRTEPAHKLIKLQLEVYYRDFTKGLISRFWWCFKSTLRYMHLFLLLKLSKKLIQKSPFKNYNKKQKVAVLSAWNKYFASAGHCVRQSALRAGHSQFLSVFCIYCWNLKTCRSLWRVLLSVTHEIVPDSDRWPALISCTDTWTKWTTWWWYSSNYLQD